jgi:hypothetical protein
MRSVLKKTVLARRGDFELGNGRVRMRCDFDVMESLHSMGLITDPSGRVESVHRTEAGMLGARSLSAHSLGGAA